MIGKVEEMMEKREENREIEKMRGNERSEVEHMRELGN